MSAPDERVDEVRSDETGSTRYEKSQSASLFGAEEYPKRSLTIRSPRSSFSLARFRA
jgi:hypothetical protein